MSASTMADAVLVAHAAFVIFVVGGFAAICVGLALNRPFARDRWFRGLHLAAIGFVVLQELLGMMCPLTIWEDALRGARTDKGFIERWIHAWMFWDWPPWVFTALYLAFGAAVAWTWYRYPPGTRKGSG